MVLCMSRPLKHPKTGVYYFRRVVPEALRAVVGKREVRVSLKTKDPREASSRHPAVAAKVVAQWDALREGPKPISLKEAVALAGEAYRDFQVLEDDPGEAALWRRVLQDNKDAQAGNFGLRLTIGEKGRKREAMEYRFGKLADHYLAKRGVLTDAEGRWKFINALAGALDDAAAKLTRNAEADYSPDPAASRYPSWTPAQVIKQHAQVATLTGILEGWWREAQATGRKPSTYESYRNTTAALVAFLGHDDARRVTPDDVIRFKDFRLASISPRTGKSISAKTVKDSDLAGTQDAIRVGRLEPEATKQSRDGHHD